MKKFYDEIRMAQQHLEWAAKAPCGSEERKYFLKWYKEHMKRAESELLKERLCNMDMFQIRNYFTAL